MSLKTDCNSSDPSWIHPHVFQSFWLVSHDLRQDSQPLFLLSPCMCLSCSPGRVPWDVFQLLLACSHEENVVPKEQGIHIPLLAWCSLVSLNKTWHVSCQIQEGTEWQMSSNGSRGHGCSQSTTKQYPIPMLPSLAHVTPCYLNPWRRKNRNQETPTSQMGNWWSNSSLVIDTLVWRAHTNLFIYSLMILQPGGGGACL